MIMPCMNSTSAGESGGSVPFVEGGRVFGGLTGRAGLDDNRSGGGRLLCARGGEEKCGGACDEERDTQEEEKAGPSLRGLRSG